MDTDKIIQDLNRRFAAPLPEFYQRRIIFWYDEDKEFEDKLDEVVLENAKVIALTGNNAFSVKKMLSVDDLTTNYLVYSPCVYNRPDDNWLLDVELYSEEFRADLISIWMDEMGLISNPAMRKQVKNYRAYFNAKDRRLKVSTQNKVPETPAQLSLMWIPLRIPLKNGELVYGMSHLRIFMTVSYKWRICKVSLRNILPDSIPQKRKVSGKNILRATIRWTLITVCSILVFKRVWRLPIFCWMICSSMLSIRWKDFIRTGS